MVHTEFAAHVDKEKGLDAAFVGATGGSSRLRRPAIGPDHHLADLIRRVDAWPPRTGSSQVFQSEIRALGFGFGEA